jgi:biotin operon repressor
MNRVDRLMAYLLLLQSRGLVRARDFARRFEISERTVYRDIQALCEAGVPIMAAPGEGYRLMASLFQPAEILQCLERFYCKKAAPLLLSLGPRLGERISPRPIGTPGTICLLLFDLIVQVGLDGAGQQGGKG